VYFLVDFIMELIGIFRATAPWLLFGFLLAGFLHVLIPERWLRTHLGQNNLRSVFLASLVGIPLPLCSCSVLPAAVAMRKGGASKGATTSFATSTPQTGIDSISMTYALMDPLMTIARPLIAFVTALSTGVVVNLTANRPSGSETIDGQILPCCDHSSSTDKSTGTIRKAFAYAYGELLNDITPWLIIGFGITALIGALIPAGALQNPSFTGLPAMLLMLAISIPLYVCAVESTPVAAMLILKGLNPGAAIVFLMAGPATNAASLTVLIKILGRRAVIIYLLSIIAFSLVAGIVVDMLYQQSGLSPVTYSEGSSKFLSPWLEIPLTLLLVALLLRSAARIKLLTRWREKLGQLSRPYGFDLGGGTAKTALIMIILILYGLTGCSVINPGETGWVVTFGRIEQTISEPGLVLHWPYPISRLEHTAITQTRSLYRGYHPVQADQDGNNLVTFANEAELTREAEVLTGDENLLVIQYSVQYKIADAFTYHFRLQDPEALLGGFAEFNLRRVICEMKTDSILVANRLLLEDAVAKRLNRELTDLNLGISIIRIDLLDVHAAPAVRYAFRDVASAMEDQHRYIRQAESYRNSIIAAARGRGETIISSAEMYKLMHLAQASSEAKHFTALAGSSRKNRELTKKRLSLETTGRTLARVRTIIPLTDLPLDLWLTTSAGQTDQPAWPGDTGAMFREQNIDPNQIYIQGNLPELPIPSKPSTDINPVIPKASPDWRDKLQDLKEKNR